MKRFLLALALVFGTAVVAEAQYPYQQPYYYQPPVRYNYSYFYMNPQAGLPNGFYMQRSSVRPAYQYNYGYPNYLNRDYSYGMGW